MQNKVKRDHVGQYDDERTERQHALLEILEEVASPAAKEDKTRAAHMADIIGYIIERMT